MTNTCTVKTGSIDTSAKEATDITGVKKDMAHAEALKAPARLTKLAAGNVQWPLKLSEMCSHTTQINTVPETISNKHT
jgi:hypothetical protein